MTYMSHIMYIFVILESCVLANLLLKTCCQKKANSYQFHSDCFSPCPVYSSLSLSAIKPEPNISENTQQLKQFCHFLHGTFAAQIAVAVCTTSDKLSTVSSSSKLSPGSVVAIGLPVAICCNESVIVNWVLYEYSNFSWESYTGKAIVLFNHIIY